ncbi:Rv3235 family protein [Plantactinospora sp. CA-290183]|uniref:Rv3235 family protein n=1 Tax=Plantactinospora sp. CA-290183 TaxID=3240006 RepID=UPI003D907128
MAAVRSRPPVRPTVRLRPVPPLDPPFDDECAATTWLGRPDTGARTEPTAPAAESPGRPDGRAPEPPGRPDGRPTGPYRRGPVAADRPTPRSPARTTPVGWRPATGQPGGAPTQWLPGVPPPAGAVASATPEARQAARRFLDTCLEIVNGHRPIGHLRRLSSPQEAADIVEQLSSGAARLCARPRPGRPAPAVRLRRMRVCEPRPGVAEAAAVVDIADRTRAVAFRMERRRGNWLAISIEVL